MGYWCSGMSCAFESCHWPSHHTLDAGLSPVDDCLRSFLSSGLSLKTYLLVRDFNSHLTKRGRGYSPFSFQVVCLPLAYSCVQMPLGKCCWRQFSFCVHSSY